MDAQTRETIRLLRGLANKLEENEPQECGMQTIPGSHISKAGEHLREANEHIIEALKDMPDGVALKHLRHLDRIVLFACDRFEDIIDNCTPED